jgi:hypothetical protein
MKIMKTSKLNQKIQSIKPNAVIRSNFDTLIDNVIVGGHLFVRSEIEDVDWNYYSKAWHRAHGPKRTISDREVTIYKYNGRAKEKLQVAATIEFDAWRGNVLLHAIKSCGLFTSPTSKAPLSVRLDKFYDAKLTRTIGNIKIYQRTLLENHVDYCAVLNGVTFHAYSIRAAVRGVHIKIKSAAKKRNSPINLKLCKELGFCDAGIKEFCNVFHIDINGHYSPKEIEELVKADPAKAAPFEHELRTVAKTLNYQISI